MIADVAPSADICSRRRGEITPYLTPKVLECERGMIYPAACAGGGGRVTPSYNKRRGGTQGSCRWCGTRSPLRHEDLIALIRSKKNWRDFRRTAKELRELIHTRKDPHCTSGIIVPDTPSSSEGKNALNSGRNDPVGAHSHSHAKSPEFEKDFFLHAASLIFSKQRLYEPCMVENQKAKVSRPDSSSSYLDEGYRDSGTSSFTSQSVDPSSPDPTKNAFEHLETHFNCDKIPEDLFAAFMIAARKKRKSNEALHDSELPMKRPSVARHGKQQNKSMEQNARVVAHLPDTIRPIKWGKRSRMDAKAWDCKVCHHVNKPERYLIADLPSFSCKNCNRPPPINYEFSFTMARARLNGYCPIGNIKDQGQKGQCLIYSTCGIVEITERMSKILAGENPEGPVLSTDHLLESYDKIRMRYDINTGPDDKKYNLKALDALCDIAVFDGIQCLDDKGAPLPGVHKAAGKRKVVPNTIEVFKKLASGTPLLTVINTGKKFQDLKPGEIYKSPKLVTARGKKLGLHAIVLIGAGKRRKCWFFHFLNSHGQMFCTRIRASKKVILKRIRKGKNFVGGFGKVRAKDIQIDPIEFLRYPDPAVRQTYWAPRLDKINSVRPRPTRFVQGRYAGSAGGRNGASGDRDHASSGEMHRDANHQKWRRGGRR